METQKQREGVVYLEKLTSRKDKRSNLRLVETPNSLREWMDLYLDLAVVGVRSRTVAEKAALHLGRFVEFGAAEMAQDALHYDTAYEASAMMVEWFVRDGEFANAGRWSAYALLFGSLMGGQINRWAAWIAGVLAGVPDPEDRRSFFDSMQEQCRSIE